MANQTDRIAKHVHGVDPQSLVDTILRNRIYESTYWRLSCFALNTAAWVDEVILQVRCIGTVDKQSGKVTEFSCLLLKLLQIQPSDDIIQLLLHQYTSKYIRALVCVYIRLTNTKALPIYQTLEACCNDYRKLVVTNTDDISAYLQQQDKYVDQHGTDGDSDMKYGGQYVVIHMDEWIDMLLTSTYVCGFTLPYLQKRSALEMTGKLKPRVVLSAAD